MTRKIVNAVHHKLIEYGTSIHSANIYSMAKRAVEKAHIEEPMYIDDYMELEELVCKLERLAQDNAPQIHLQTTLKDIADKMSFLELI